MPGQVKLKLGGSHAGHNGLKDIRAQLGSPDFWRLRLGIGHAPAERVMADADRAVAGDERAERMPIGPFAGTAILSELDGIS